jgi:hypothetical protein
VTERRRGARLRAWLDGARPWRLAAIVAIAISLPALGLGLQADDHLLRANLARDPAWSPLQTPAWDAFHFYPHAAAPAWAADRGLGLWWSHREMHARFFRPVSSLTHALDFRVVRAPWLMHVESILLYALVCALAALLFRRLIHGWAAGLAALLYAVDHTHGVVASWLANRNALVAGAFGLGALVAHHAWRRGGGRWAVWLAPPLVALALGSGESGLASVAYLGAYALCLETGSIGRRLATVLPYTPVVVGWAVIYKLGGYGAQHSGLYLDPGAQPGAFLRALPASAALHLGAELGAPSPDMWILLSTTGRLVLVAIALGVLALVGGALAPLLRRDATARFFALGAVLAVVPGAGTFPSARLLLVPGFGLIGLVARLFAAWRDRADWWPSSRGRRLAGAAAALLAGGGHLVLSPPLAVFSQQQIGMVDRLVARVDAGLPHGAGVVGQRLVLVTVPDTLVAMYILPERSTRGEPLPRAILPLARATHAISVEGVDAHTLLVRDPRGFFGDGFSLLTRSPDDRMAAGTRLSIDDVELVVTETTPDGRPTALRVQLAARLDDPSIVWRAWDGRAMAPFTPPAPGQRGELPAQPHPLMRFE